MGHLWSSTDYRYRCQHLLENKWVIVSPFIYHHYQSLRGLLELRIHWQFRTYSLTVFLSGGLAKPHSPTMAQGQRINSFVNEPTGMRAAAVQIVPATGRSVHQWQQRYDDTMDMILGVKWKTSDKHLQHVITTSFCISWTDFTFYVILCSS